MPRSKKNNAGTCKIQANGIHAKQRNKGPIQQYSEETLIQALTQVKENGLPVATAAKRFGVPRTTLRDKLSGKTSENMKTVGPEAYLGREIEDQLVDWILKNAANGFPVNKEGLVFSVKKIVERSNIQTPFVDNTPGRKWIDSFLKRHPIVTQKHAEYVNRARASITEEKIRYWFREVKDLLRDDVEVLNHPHRIWNMDETAIFLSPKGALVLAERGKSSYDVTSTSEKDNVTTLIVANGVGQYAPPLTVFKYTRLPRTVIDAAPPNWSLGKSDTGWMRSETFLEYFTNVFHPFLLENEIELPVIVFLDGHSSHLSLDLSKFCKENSIIVVCLPPNATHIMQPLDVALFSPLKQSWKNFTRKWMYEHNGESIKKKDVPSALNELLKIKSFTQSIVSGFRVCGLYPFNPEAVNYGKCLIKSQQHLNDNENTNREDEGIEKSENTINNIETYLSKISVLNLFESTYENNIEWDGDIRFTELYQFWKHIKGSANNVSTPYEVITEQNTEEIDPTNILEFPFPEWNEVENVSVNISSEGSSVVLTEIREKVNVIQNIVVMPANSELQLEGGSLKHEVSKNKLLNDGTEKTSEILKDVLNIICPTSSKRKRNVAKLPSVLTSNEWISLREAKEKENLEKEEARQMKKKIKEQSKKLTNKEEKNTKKQKKKLRDDENNSTRREKETEICKDAYVIVQYDKSFYPAKVLEVNDKGALCKAMEKTENNWKWPEEEDSIWYKFKDIMEVIEAPIAVSNNAFYVQDINLY